MPSVDKEFFAQNRRRLFELLPDKSALLLTSASLKTRSWDSHYPFCQDKNFYYLTGYEHRSAAILMKKSGKMLSTTLFVIQLTPLQIHWNGHLPSPEEAKVLTGIDSVLAIDSLYKQLATALNSVDSLYLDFQPVPPNEPMSENLQLAEKIRLTNPHVSIRRAHSILAQLREIKNKLEIDRIRQAVRLTQIGIQGLLGFLKPGITEYELEASFDFELHRRRSKPAFQTIIACGSNATVLHYNSLDKTVNDNELVLLDLGAEYEHYSADISRTLPVNGRFSHKQRSLYQVVLDANIYTINAIKPGISMSTLNEMTKEILGKGLKKLGYISDIKEVSRYYTHGVSHSLGLDTHDIVSGVFPSLKPGMVITVEPGLYLPEIGIGIRIEDNILVTEEGHANLSAEIPKEADAIEKWITQSQGESCQNAAKTQPEP